MLVLLHYSALEVSPAHSWSGWGGWGGDRFTTVWMHLQGHGNVTKEHSWHRKSRRPQASRKLYESILKRIGSKNDKCCCRRNKFVSAPSSARNQSFRSWKESKCYCSSNSVCEREFKIFLRVWNEIKNCFLHLLLKKIFFKKQTKLAAVCEKWKVTAYGNVKQ